MTVYGDIIHGAQHFSTGYMDQALDDLASVIERAKLHLRDVDFDTIIGTGFSGGVVVPALALAMGKRYALVRKESDNSHHGPGRIMGTIGERWLFLDDLVASGSTRRYVLRRVNEALESRGHKAVRVGQYLYMSHWNDDRGRFYGAAEIDFADRTESGS